MVRRCVRCNRSPFYVACVTCWGALVNVICSFFTGARGGAGRQLRSVSSTLLLNFGELIGGPSSTGHHAGPAQRVFPVVSLHRAGRAGDHQRVGCLIVAEAWSTTVHAVITGCRRV